MKILKPHCLLFWLVLLCLPTALQADSSSTLSPQVREQIDYLLHRVEDSGYIFVRNGTEHDSAEAAQHMRRKFEHFLDKGDIASVDDFIDLAGTQSLITRRKYMVRLPDGTELPTAQWLRAELEELPGRNLTGGAL
ncbi:MAG: DUF5329 family protein [Gammaproteobacteria bacterium]|jgi:hypothetical protein